MNVKLLLDLNIIFDCYSHERQALFPESVQLQELLATINNAQGYISSSALDNLSFIKYQELKQAYPELARNQINKIIELFITEILEQFKLAKTPSYIKIDFEDIEDSQMLASAQAIDAKLVTRDKRLLTKYKNETLSTTDAIKLLNTPVAPAFVDLQKQYIHLQEKIEQRTDTVLNHGQYIMGPEVKELERQLEGFTSAKNAITCSSGTDALLLAMMAIDIQPDDEVITTAFSFIATAETIALLKAKPVFVDIEESTFNIDVTKIEAAITSKTKAIMPVSLYGQPADMDEINAIAKKHKLKVIIDGAQSFGATYKNQAEVHHCDIFTTSFFPAKPLGCYGDGGAVFTNNSDHAEKIKILRVHGQNKRYHHKYIGLGARLDTLQAAVLLAKLPDYSKEIELRQKVASEYNKALQSTVETPLIKADRTSVWAQYTMRVKKRDELQTKLKEQGIPAAVHYPMPLHLQECFQYLGLKEGDFPVSEKASFGVMSLPMDAFLSAKERVSTTDLIVRVI